MSWLRLEAATVDPDLDRGSRRARRPVLAARPPVAAASSAARTPPTRFHVDPRAPAPLDSVRIGGRPAAGSTRTRRSSRWSSASRCAAARPARGSPPSSASCCCARLAAAQVPASGATTCGAPFRWRCRPTTGSTPRGRRRLELLARLSLDGGAAAAAFAPNAPLSTLPVFAAAPATVKSSSTTSGLRLAAVARRRLQRARRGRAWDAEPDGVPFAVGARRRVNRTRTPTATEAGGSSGTTSTGRAEPGSPPDRRRPRRELLPAPLRFRGMPASRFWEFENADVYFGGIDTAPEDLARGGRGRLRNALRRRLVRHSDRPRAGTLAQIEAGRGGRLRPRRRSRRRRATTASGRGVPLLRDHRRPRAGRHDLAPLLLDPADCRDHRSAARPLEDVGCLRDEAANLAWAVEHRVESCTGRPVDLPRAAGAPTRRPPKTIAGATCSPPTSPTTGCRSCRCGSAATRARSPSSAGASGGARRPRPRTGAADAAADRRGGGAA